MKIDANQIPPEGLTLTEEFSPQDLDLETDIIKFRGKVLTEANVSKIANAVTVSLNLNALLYANCSRCLNEIEFSLKKEIELNYPIDKSEPRIDASTPSFGKWFNKLAIPGTIPSKVKGPRTSPERSRGALSVNGERSLAIDLNPDIREEIILVYPIKPLCSIDCKGLCPKCGKNLNEGKCNC
jgi:uncharacterized protein